MVKGVKISLPDQQIPFSVRPNGSYYWWSGSENLLTSAMAMKSAVTVPAEGATLSFKYACDVESGYDHFRVLISSNNGVSWNALDDFTGTSTGYPALQSYSRSLGAYAGQSILLRLEYQTDEGVLLQGVFIDDISVSGGTFSDNAESTSAYWNYSGTWGRNNGSFPYSHNYYLQWRNVGSDGGYDSALGDSKFRYGPTNSGLLVWYNNNYYTDNEVAYYLDDGPSWGPKGRMLVVDSHPEPYRFTNSYRGEVTNANSRGQMRDAPFSKNATVPFTYAGANFPSRSALDTFDDAVGMYPGIELAYWYWFTKAWDASAVLPGLKPYTIRELEQSYNYYNTSQLCYGMYLDNSEIQGWCYNGISNLGGGAGNPGESLGQYGWHVKILDQEAKKATLRIWNSATGGASDSKVPYLLSVGKTGSGTIVSSSVPAISCGSICSQYYLEGTNVTLSAAGSGGVSFKGWSGAGCSGIGDCPVSMTSDRTVSATFGTCYTLQLVAPENGTIEAVTPPNCEGGKYAPGTPVQLSAFPSQHYDFAGWSGANSDGTVVMEADRSVSASFTARCHALQLKSDPSDAGTVSASPPPNCGAKYIEGTPVQLSASPSEHYDFAGWTGASGDGTLVIDTEKTVAARFSAKCYALSLSASPAKGGSVSAITQPNCDGGKYMYGTAVRVSATPATAFRLNAWSGADGSGNLVIAGDTAVAALFSPIACLKVVGSVKPRGKGKIAFSPKPNCGRGKGFYSGTNVKVTIKPGRGYRLSSWSGVILTKSQKKKKTILVTVQNSLNLKATLKR